MKSSAKRHRHADAERKWTELKYDMTRDAFRAARNMLTAFFNQGSAEDDIQRMRDRCGEASQISTTEYEYATTMGSCNTIPPDAPNPPPDDGWQLVSVTSCGERGRELVWTWKRRKAASNIDNEPRVAS